MNALYRQFVIALALLALCSVAVFYLLTEYPLLMTDDQDGELVEAFSLKVDKRLRETERKDWQEVIKAMTEGTDFEIEIIGSDDIDMWLPIEQLALLRQDERSVFVADDGRTVVDMLYVEQDTIVEVYSTRGELIILGINYGAIFAVLMLLAVFITILVARPIARRLNRLEQLAESYGHGNWQARAGLESDEAIGRVGQRMEAMAANISAILEQKDGLVDDQQHLLSAVAHEFRGPLARLRFALDMSEDTDADSLQKNQHEMSQALEELNSLVTEVLQFGRLNLGPADQTVRRADLLAVARDAKERCEKLPAAKPISISANLPKALLAVEPHLLERAIGNLLGNACKYASQEAMLSWQIEADSVIIYVDDDGPGIPPKERTRVLQPFTRLDTSRTRATGGHGLGLAIVQRIVTGVGGNLAISDSPIGGTRITMTLPLAGLQS